MRDVISGVCDYMHLNTKLYMRMRAPRLKVEPEPLALIENVRSSAAGRTDEHTTTQASNMYIISFRYSCLVSSNLCCSSRIIMIVVYSPRLVGLMLCVGGFSHADVQRASTTYSQASAHHTRHTAACMTMVHFTIHTKAAPNVYVCFGLSVVGFE